VPFLSCGFGQETSSEDIFSTRVGLAAGAETPPDELVERIGGSARGSDAWMGRDRMELIISSLRIMS
jgi:hypothetical protein